MVYSLDPPIVAHVRSPVDELCQIVAIVWRQSDRQTCDCPRSHNKLWNRKQRRADYRFEPVWRVRGYQNTTPATVGGPKTSRGKINSPYPPHSDKKNNKKPRTPP